LNGDGDATDHVLHAVNLRELFARRVDFRRGHINTDNTRNVADAVCLLTYLFGPSDDPCKESVAQCLDGADANDDGRVNIGDAIMLLSHLFLEATLPPPSEACGPDETEDGLGCTVFEMCEEP
jgi:hypothetical protein